MNAVLTQGRCWESCIDPNIIGYTTFSSPTWRSRDQHYLRWSRPQTIHLEADSLCPGSEHRRLFVPQRQVIGHLHILCINNYPSTAMAINLTFNILSSRILLISGNIRKSKFVCFLALLALRTCFVVKNPLLNKIWRRSAPLAAPLPEIEYYVMRNSKCEEASIDPVNYRKIQISNPVSPRLNQILSVQTIIIPFTTTPKPTAQAALKCPLTCSNNVNIIKQSNGPSSI